MSYIIVPPSNKGVLSAHSFPLILSTGGLVVHPASSLTVTVSIT